MGKRKFTEAERRKRVEYQRAYRAQKSQDPTWRRRESQRKKTYYVPKARKTSAQLAAYNREYKHRMRERAKVRKAAKALAEARRQREEQAEAAEDSGSSSTEATTSDATVAGRVTRSAMRASRSKTRVTRGAKPSTSGASASTRRGPQRDDSPVAGPSGEPSVSSRRKPRKQATPVKIPARRVTRASTKWFSSDSD